MTKKNSSSHHNLQPLEGTISCTLLPACWILKKTDFHLGLLSFFKTSVLQIGTATPLSVTFDMTRKGSCKKQQKPDSPCHLCILQKGTDKKVLRVHTLFENKSLDSSSEHLRTNSVVVFEVKLSSAKTVICPSFLGIAEPEDSGVSKRSKFNDLFDLVIIYNNMKRFCVNNLPLQIWETGLNKGHCT